MPNKKDIPKIDVDYDAIIRHTELIMDAIKDKDNKYALDMTKHLKKALEIYRLFNSV
jgi:hypothetical protein